VRKGRFRCEVLRSPPVISFALEQPNAATLGRIS
jgi:hypothetical protein